MQINKEMLEELLTNDGHTGNMIFAKNTQALTRREGTIRFLEDRNVTNIVHIGCCGHLQNIKKQMETHTHFHEMLVQSFDKVVGFDINKEAIKYLSTYAISGIYANDFVEDIETVNKILVETFGEESYAILLPEVLEHIPNPVDFLSKIVNQHGKANNKIIITVPNAYGFGRVRDALLHSNETINMDHKYMFTPVTLLKVMCVSGITPVDIDFLDLYKYSKIFKKPMLANTIIAEGTIV